MQRPMYRSESINGGSSTESFATQQLPAMYKELHTIDLCATLLVYVSQMLPPRSSRYAYTHGSSIEGRVRNSRYCGDTTADSFSPLAQILILPPTGRIRTSSDT